MILDSQLPGHEPNTHQPIINHPISGHYLRFLCCSNGQCLQVWVLPTCIPEIVSVLSSGRSTLSFLAEAGVYLALKEVPCLFLAAFSGFHHEALFFVSMLNVFTVVTDHILSPSCDHG